MVVVGKQIHHCLVGFVDVFLFARKCHPAERTFAFAKQRADIRRHEAGIIKGIFNAIVEGTLPKIVAVIKDDCPAFLIFEHCFNVLCHRVHHGFFIGRLIFLAKLSGLFDAVTDWNVAVKHIVSRGLIGDDIGDDAFFK